ncbi:winged helix-turn-helix transcriptional regulator [Rubellimicrobium rubrum]|uniref:winged helix-turn-helix transcriptional regulator n=1 Tax=Rubellimicrobium rubrum TaxID=2585369 RepID=UPI00159B8C96|nr:helix-turn-helix domain-containing protein [Rubellimicrobium rubrum]
MARVAAAEKKALTGHLVTPRKPSGVDPAYDVYCEACPTRLVLDRLADKWVLLVMGLLGREPLRFNQLRREIEGVSQKVLSQTLKRLERDGLVARQAFATVPVTVEYSITPLGRTLSDTVRAVGLWAETNIEAVLAAQAAYDAQSGTEAGAQTSRATT